MKLLSINITKQKMSVHKFEKLIMSFLLLFSVHVIADPTPEKPGKSSVLEIAEKVIDWQLANLPANTDEDWWKQPTVRTYGKHLLDWEYGTFYSGLMDVYKADPQTKYLEVLMDMGEGYRWYIRPRLWDANVLQIGQVYLELYKLKKKQEMLEMIEYALSTYFNRHPKEPDITFKNNRYWWSWWSWCDALFMAPPTFVKYAEVTGQPVYLDKMHELYVMVYDYLYDKSEKLFFRDDRFFDQRSSNGEKIFWARGNGWVVAGLAKMLQSMPKDYSNRAFYETLLKEMASRLKEIQQPEGHWSSNLLDASHFRSVETSGTGLICYALAYGINNGYLDKGEYYPVVEKAWGILTKSVHPDGKLGYVQWIGDSPAKVTYESTAAFGVGAFLLAASEVYKLIP
jgi:unsaturated rhamnogalacturonyl hydrolase